MKVTYKTHMGDDLMVVNAARVSFDKESDWVPEDVNDWDWLANTLKPTDKKLISYLARHNHWSPFSHPQIQLHVKAPIFVARQLQKHTVGCAWNEVSRRYVDSKPQFYWPTEWRGKAEDKKQGSSEKIIKEPMFLHSAFMKYISYYDELLEDGVCPEQARMILPQNMYTEWYWTGSLYYFARVCKQRLDPHAQAETQEVARQISDIIEPLFPVSWEALIGN